MIMITMFDSVYAAITLLELLRDESNVSTLVYVPINTAFYHRFFITTNFFSLIRILDRGLCDIRHRPCIRTIVFGEYFVDSKNLTCHINEYMVMTEKKTKQINK